MQKQKSIETTLYQLKDVCQMLYVDAIFIQRYYLLNQSDSCVSKAMLCEY